MFLKKSHFLAFGDLGRTVSWIFCTCLFRSMFPLFCSLPKNWAIRAVIMDPFASVLVDFSQQQALAREQRAGWEWGRLGYLYPEGPPCQGQHLVRFHFSADSHGSYLLILSYSHRSCQVLVTAPSSCSFSSGDHRSAWSASPFPVAFSYSTQPCKQFLK